MNLDRFLGLPGTPGDDRKIVTLMADPAMTDAAGQPAGFLSLVDRGANQRTFQVVKADGDDPTNPPGDLPQAWLARFLEAVGFAGLAQKLARKDDGGPLTFDAAITAERLRRARWESTDALWEVIRNIMAADAATVPDKPAAVQLALGQFSANVMALVKASAALAQKGEDVAPVIAALDVPADGSDLAQKAGRSISAANMAKLQSALEAMRAAMAAMAELQTANDPPLPAAMASKADDPEDPMLSPAQVTAMATAAADSAVKAAKSAGLTDPARLAQIGADASTTVFKSAVMGPAQPAMPTGTLMDQIGQSGGMNGQAGDPLALMNQALGQVTALATKVESLVAKVDAVDKAINGHGEGDAREPGMLEIATKSAELAGAVAQKVAKIESTPAAPRGAGDPPQIARKGADDRPDTWAGSALDFTGGKPAPAAS